MTLSPTVLSQALPSRRDREHTLRDGSQQVIKNLNMTRDLFARPHVPSPVQYVLCDQLVPPMGPVVL